MTDDEDELDSQSGSDLDMEFEEIGNDRDRRDNLDVSSDEEMQSGSRKSINQRKTSKKHIKSKLRH